MAVSPSIRPSARATAYSLTLASSRLAIRGVPRLRTAILRAPAPVIGTPIMGAERTTIRSRSSGS